MIPFGGEAPLTEIYNIVVQLFEKDRTAGERVISKLQPHAYTNSEENMKVLKINRSLMILCNHA